MDQSSEIDIDEKSGEQECKSLSLEVEEIFGEVTGFSRSWMIANKLVDEFDPVSWSLWRLIGFIMSRGMRINAPPDGMLMGYLKFLKRVGADPILGTEQELRTNGLAAKHLKPDIIAGALFAHSLSCRLNSRPLKKIWAGMLDDSLLRACIGVELGKYRPDFGLGRCFVAGLAGRVGLITLIATGSHQQAARTLQSLARGGEIVATGLGVYSTDPFQVMAQILLRGGFGIDAAVGVLSFGHDAFVPSNQVQLTWRSVSRVIDTARNGTYGRLTSQDWEQVRLLDPELREDFKDATKLILRKGHGWIWITEPSGEAPQE